jgi:hypothetical protein
MARGGARMTLLHCRTIDLAAVRDAMTDALEAGTFYNQPIRVCPWLADQWSPPCALIGTFTVEFTDTSYEGLTTAAVNTRLVVPTQALRPAQQDLDLFLTAYVDALNAAPNLGGACMRVIPVRAQPITTPYGNQDLASYDVDTTVVL